MMKNLKLFLVILAILVIVLVVSCAKQVSQAESGTEDSGVDGVETSEEPVTEMPAEVIVEDGNGAVLEPVVIEIVAATEITPYNPKVLVGQEVVWLNKHVEGKDDREFKIRGAGDDKFESELLKPGDEFTHIYSKPGDYQYKIMPGSAGRVSVVGNVVKWFKAIV